MLLPPGTLKALKSQPDAIVAVVAIFLALAALKVDENAIAVAGLVCIGLGSTISAGGQASAKLSALPS